MTESHNAASSLRRRTSCIYCGRRISGRLPEYGMLYPPRGMDAGRITQELIACRVACREHMYLVGSDPDYRERL